MSLTRIAALGAAVTLAAPVAAQMATYRCTAKDGKKYYSSTIPRQCIGRPIEQLNSQGLVVRRIDPEGDEEAKAAKAAAAAKKREEEVAGREERRRNQALLATYTSEKDIDDARARALAENRKAILEVETRIAATRKRRAGYEKELEFYEGGAKPPAKLAEDMQNADVEIKANEELLALKKKEVAHINARYDEDKKRYQELTGKRPAEAKPAADKRSGIPACLIGRWKSNAAKTLADMRRHPEINAKARALFEKDFFGHLVLIITREQNGEYLEGKQSLADLHMDENEIVEAGPNYAVLRDHSGGASTEQKLVCEGKEIYAPTSKWQFREYFSRLE